MQILIVGAGIVGFNLAEELSKEGHDISIVDEDMEKIKQISEKLDVLWVRGNACLPSILMKAGIEKAEMVIAVTNKDEINLFVCMLAHKFKVKKRFARLRHMEFTDGSQVFSPDDLYIDQAVNPGQIIIDFILSILETPGAVNCAEFAEGKILLRGFDVPDDAPLAGKKIAELRTISEFNSFIIVAIVRNGDLIIPKGQDEIHARDKIYMLIDREFLPLILPMLNKKVDNVQKVILFGANTVSINLAGCLENRIDDISIIEPTLEKADQAVDQLSKTVVLHGDGTDPDLFNEINIRDADFFMALTDDDEHNILSALLAKKHGAKRAVVITNDPYYLPILDSIGMNITINPRLFTVSAILKNLRKGQIRSVYKLIENEVEVLEIMIDPNSTIANKKIGNLKFPKGAIIGAILREEEMLVPDDESALQTGDSVIVVSMPESIEKIEKLFTKKKLF
ncbi:MAG: Trk system potassium transporter TrkA [Nitrospinota bacterium]|nr:Trk system potassium transporter TrkA [Nitrospinota bacterium]